MSVVVRWTLTDTGTAESVRLPLNPHKMDAPTRPRNMTWAWGTAWGQERMRGIDVPGPATEWTWSGVLLTESHYALLLAWTARLAPLHLSDHLGRTFQVVIKKFDPIERLPNPLRPWRADYTMTCLLLKEIP